MDRENIRKTSDLSRYYLQIWKLTFYFALARDAGKKNSPPLIRSSLLLLWPSIPSRSPGGNSHKIAENLAQRNVRQQKCDTNNRISASKVMASLRSRRVRSFAYDDASKDVDGLSSLGGMCGAIVTSPFDVVKTRLQSSLFREGHAAVGVIGGGGGGAVLHAAPRHGGLLWNFVETGHILRYVVLQNIVLWCLKLVSPQ